MIPRPIAFMECDGKTPLFIERDMTRPSNAVTHTPNHDGLGKIANAIPGWSALLFLTCVFVLLPVSAQAGGALDSIRASGVLLWGSDAEGGAPYIFPDPDNPGKLIGFEADLADAIAAKLGVTARQTQTHWASLIPALKRGDFHMAMNGIEWTAERAREVDFSDPYYIFFQQLVVRADEDAIHSLDDLKGRLVGTLGGSAAHTMLQALPGVQTKIYEGQVEPYRDLGVRRLDAVLLDSPISDYHARPNPQLKYAGKPEGENVYVIAMRKGDDAFRDEINRIIDTLFRSGELKTLYDRWGLWNDHQSRLRTIKTAAPAASTTSKPGLLTYATLLLQGAGMTLLISTTAMVLAMALGLVLVLARLTGGRILKSIAVAWIEIIRGTPLLLQLYIVYYGLPNIGIKLEAFTAAVLALGINYAAYEAEIYRAGLESIPKGQREAALSLGMTQFMVYRRILIPQAVRTVLPPVTNDFIALFKDSSLVSVIAIVELTKSYNMLAVSSMRFLELGALTAALYLMMSLPLSFLTRRLERNLSVS